MSTLMLRGRFFLNFKTRFLWPLSPKSTNTMGFEAFLGRDLKRLVTEIFAKESWSIFKLCLQKFGKKLGSVMFDWSRPEMISRFSCFWISARSCACQFTLRLSDRDSLIDGRIVSLMFSISKRGAEFSWLSKVESLSLIEVCSSRVLSRRFSIPF